MAKIWTEEHEEFIREQFHSKTYAELAEYFGVTQKAMESKIRRMGLKKQDPPPQDAEAAIFATPPLGAMDTAPAERGLQPIHAIAALPRRIEQPAETAKERSSRLEAERDAAEVEKVRRENNREAGEMKVALERFEGALDDFHGGSYGKAVKTFRAIAGTAQIDPWLQERARQYAGTCERRGRTVTFSPQDADETYLYGVMLLNSGDPDAALDAFASALEQAPGDDRVLYCQAAAHVQRGAIDEAIDALRDAIDINESNRIFALNDPDFVPLRVHQDFSALVTRTPGAGDD